MAIYCLIAATIKDYLKPRLYHIKAINQFRQETTASNSTPNNIPAKAAQQHHAAAASSKHKAEAQGLPETKPPRLIP
ncbi:hypothetical protein EIKCOROL_01284 [Eikenella corrodens ATCC 23834]|uniref:Uncharacterized protein n=1 Tax=Eikenella corrodens ATCC 23834 TaxID=546274 RepID=C0DV95_EIKCO|nr:hypothetical protein EIKCOROL_01284 [Eikenella corrodens ATCC 23834]